MPADLVPECIFAKVRDDPLKVRNWVRITGGVHVISERFSDVLVDFDIGTTQILEVPYVDRHGVPRPERWFLFHISEMKSCLAPGIKEKDFAPGNWEPGPMPEEVLAVTARSLDGVDVWYDLHLAGRIFLSDRLKSALTAAGIRSYGLKLHPCIVID